MLGIVLISGLRWTLIMKQLHQIISFNVPYSLVYVLENLFLQNLPFFCDWLIFPVVSVESRNSNINWTSFIYHYILLNSKIVQSLLNLISFHVTIWYFVIKSNCAISAIFIYPSLTFESSIKCIQSIQQ